MSLLNDKSEQGNILWAEVRQALKKSFNYWLNTTQPDGRPDALPIWGLWLENPQSFVFYTERTTRKARNLSVEPYAVVHLESGDHVVIVEGGVEPITDAEFLQTLNQGFFDKYKEPTSGRGFQPAQALRDPVAYRLLPKQVRAWQKGNIYGQNRWTFEATITVKPETLPEVAPSAVPPQQPHDPANPGSDAYPYAEAYEDTWEIWHEELGAIWPTRVHLFMPQTSTIPTGGFPVLAVSPGKALGLAGYYRAFLEHVALKGYIVLFIVTEAGLLDCEHERMAGEFLNAVNDALAHRLATNAVAAGKIGWWGHSMGSKVTAIAARLTNNPDYLKPTFVIGTAFTNAKAFCSADAFAGATNIPTDIYYTLLPGQNDTIAPIEESLTLYDAMPQVTNRQVIEVNGNTADGLVADHAAPMSAGSIPLTSEHAVVNALDWYGYWKWTVGALDYHFKGGPDSWTYGAERLDGGIDSAGNQLEYTQLRQSWQG